MEGNGRDISGRFAKGHSGFKTRSPEFQRHTRQELGKFLQDNLKQLPEIFSKLKPRDQAALLIDVAQFFLPKQKEILHDVADSVNVDYSLLDSETLDKVLNATK